MKHIRVSVRSSQEDAILFYVSADKAREMLESGEAIRISARKAPLELRLVELNRPLHCSPAAITAAETERAIDGNPRDRAKLDAWSTVGQPPWRWRFAGI